MNTEKSSGAATLDIEKAQAIAEAFNSLPEEKRIALIWIAEGMKIAASMEAHPAMA